MNRQPNQWQGADPELKLVHDIMQERVSKPSPNARWTIEMGHMEFYQSIFTTSFVNKKLMVERCHDTDRDALFLELGERAATCLILDTHAIKKNISWQKAHRGLFRFLTSFGMAVYDSV